MVMPSSVPSPTPISITTAELPCADGSMLYHGRSLADDEGVGDSPLVLHVSSRLCGRLDTFLGSQPRSYAASQLHRGSSSTLKFQKIHPTPSSNAEILCSASCCSMASSLSHGLETEHRPLLGAEGEPVPRGPGDEPCGGPAMPDTCGLGQTTEPHSTFGKPGALSWKPLSHMLQLSVASDHSQTRMGSDVSCSARMRCRQLHAFSRKLCCDRMSNHACCTCVSSATPWHPFM
mmetsp:Transcript_55369/g.120659  ORF Transcript_55369/g.120659 Transcript_55369/m.120659 type:complete len:233 (+) Transcript_55369:344-1042(+)